MLISSLRQKILDRAIRGLLVEQRSEDGTAEELYQQIQVEKKKLIVEGKIKKEKPLPEIEEDKMPFDIPETWKWLRLHDISSVISKGTTPRGGNASYSSSGIVFLRAENVAGFATLDKSNLKYVTEVNHHSFLKRSILEENDILITIAGTLGRTALVTEKDLPLNANQAIAFIRPLIYDKVFLKYIIYALNAPEIQQRLLKQKKVTAIPNLTLENIDMCCIPVPPLEEQKRIVQKVESLFSKLDIIAESKKRVTGIQTALKKRILDQAIQGKLVPQRPEEGTAEELYQQIQTEKKRLIAEGKIKKEKPLPPIEEKDIPFDIPETWKWVRLRDCGTLTRGSGIKKNEIVVEGKPCVRYGQLYTTYKTRFIQAVSRVPQGLFDKCKQANKGDILMALTGENKVDIAMAVLYEGEETLAIGGDMTKFSPTRIDPLYFVYTLNSPYGINCKTERSTGDLIVHTSNDRLSTIPIPLPPLAEQQRIVAKIEEMLTYCKSLH